MTEPSSITAWQVHGGRDGRLEQHNLDNGVITLGWGYWLTEEDLARIDDRRELNERLEQVLPNKNARSRGQIRGFIERFCTGMKVGDLIALPLRQSGKVTNFIAVGWVRGAAEIDIAQGDDNARLHRPVNWETRRVARPVGLPKGRPTVQEFERGAVQELTQILEKSFLSGNEAGVLAQGNLEYPEGAKTRVEVNRYERNPEAREACIREHGIACKVCGLVFEKRYGQLGRGYIHVHHIIPLSQIGKHGAYTIDPTKDLVPVCPNCHAMLHHKRSATPLTVAELRRIIDDVSARDD